MTHPESDPARTPEELAQPAPPWFTTLFRSIGRLLEEGTDSSTVLGEGLGLISQALPARGFALVQGDQLIVKAGLAESAGGDLSFPLRYLGKEVGQLLVFSPGDGFNDARLRDLLPLLATVVANHRPAHTLAGILERLSEGVILADSSGTIRLVNAAASTLLGVRMGHNVQFSSLFQDPTHAQEALQGAKRATGFRGERPLLGPAGPFPAHISGNPLEGDSGQILWIFYDLSPLRQGERARRRQEMLDAISSLAAGAAHELNNPLSGVMGFAQLLAEDPSDVEAPRYLSLILEQVKRCQGVIRKLLLFGQNHPIHQSKVQLSALLDAAFERGGYKWRLGTVQINRHIDDGLPELLGDRELLEQALFQILENAYAAMPDGGELTITASALEGRESILGVRTLKIEITDTGEGIPTQLLERVLDPFFTTREVGLGSGMGLTIAYGVIREHGGQIDLHSVPWEGTTVSLLLPITGPPGLVPADSAHQFLSFNGEVS